MAVEMHDLSGKTILVTGASKGIGAAIVTALGEAGAQVIAHYGSDRAGVEEATANIPEDRRHLIAADLGETAGVERLWREALAWRGGIDVFVNNAAVMRVNGGIDADDETWDAVWNEAMKVNVLAPARLMRNAVRHYLENGGGAIITMSSWVAQRGPGSPAMLAYAASKAAVMATTKTIARHYGKHNILAYSIAPGVVRTRMSEDFAASTIGEEAVTAGLAMGEWVPPSDLANLVTFLSTGACRHLNGATLDVNGATYIR
jgi:NAD(P)-dependent dehydrogenase (short-subunit alcohol dehydrogenase family)